MDRKVHPVDEILPVPKLLTLGLQHVLVMYAGAVAVPLILGRALKLSPEDVAFLISADLFACGLATLVQCVGFPGVGASLFLPHTGRLPLLPARPVFGYDLLTQR